MPSPASEPPSQPQPPGQSSGQPQRILRLHGALDIHTIPTLRKSFLAEVESDRQIPFAVEASGITHIDGVGLGFIAELRLASTRLFNRPLEIHGFPPAIDHLLKLSAMPSSLFDVPRRHPHPLVALGRSSAIIWNDVALLLIFLGQLVGATASIIRSPRQMRWNEFPGLCRSVGADALVIISLLGFLIGAILAFQTSVPLDRFGAIELIPTIVGIAVVRELGPLIAAILVAGRTGAAFAAEIGTMRVTEELSALRVIGIDPLTFLVFPRILAMVLMLPILCVYTDILGVLGGYIVMSTRGFSLIQYLQSFKSGVEVSDVTGGLIKTLAFAVLIASAGCQSGLRTGAGPGAVGLSTTRAVVWSIVLIIFADLMFGFIYYSLGM